MNQSVEYVFISGYTARGRCSYLASILNRVERLIVLAGPPGTGKSTLMKNTGLAMIDRGYSVQFWPSPLDPACLEGAFFPQLKTALVNGKLALEPEELPAHTRVISVNMMAFGDLAELTANRTELDAMAEELEKRLEDASTTLEAAMINRDREHAAARLNPEKLQNVSRRLASEILGWQEREMHYFASAVTAEGVVDYFEELTGSCRRFLLHGPPAAGKSWLMQTVAQEALNRGHQVSYYHSGLDPDDLEMVIIDTLQVALIDANAAGLKERRQDRVIDLKGCLIEEPERTPAGAGGEAGTAAASGEQERAVSEAVRALGLARRTERILSRQYTPAMMFDRVDARREELLREILGLKPVPFRQIRRETTPG
ncbi:MAG: hypothetical protein ACM3QZ_02205 [Solirubrobacterales bacterium]